MCFRHCVSVSNCKHYRMCVKCASGCKKRYTHQIPMQISQPLTLHPVHHLARCPLAYRFHDQSHRSGSFCGQCQTKAQTQWLGSVSSVLLISQIWSLHSDRLVRAPLVMCPRRIADYEKNDEALSNPDYGCVCVRVRKSLRLVQRIPLHLSVS